LANIQYISIIRLFESCSIDIDQEIILSRVKKQLNTEFDFSEAGFIEIENFVYNKNDVFDEIDKVDFITRFDFHKKIWSSKTLLTILENNRIDDIGNLYTELDRFTNNPAFDSFVSPYFANSFNHISRKYISDENFKHLNIWLGYQDFIQIEDREDAFKAIRLFLDDHLRTIANTNDVSYKFNKNKLLFWMKLDTIDFMNQLPEDFYFIKNQLIEKLIDLAVEIEKSYRDDSKYITNTLYQLKNIDPNLKNIIDNNHKVYNHAPASNISVSDDSGFNWRWLWVIVIAIKVLVSLQHC
jgi:hypothetical protein